MQDASLRFNLDPFNQAPHETIVSALQKTQLWSDLSRGRGSDASDNDVSDILNRPISELSFLSVGQEQLLSFTRALVRKETLRLGPSAACKPILLLDEATSSLDPATESLINDLIDKEFSSQGHTVIIVAHRASVLTKWMRPGIDQVVLMSDGQVERVCSAESVLYPVVIPAPPPLL
jgi:ABC-type multidrug transport system fused ATPase/permease subunit